MDLKISLVLISLLGILAISYGKFLPKATFYNPVFDQPWPDPYVYLHSDGFYYMTRSESNGIALYRSRQLTNFRNAERKLIYTAPTGLMNLWAPEMHYIQGGWYVYFALDDGDNANHRMYVISCRDADPMNGNWMREIR